MSYQMPRKKAKTKIFRLESDSLGKVRVPADMYYGAQTKRSLMHFSIGDEQIPNEFIVALAYVKYACSLANVKIGTLSKTKQNYISKVCKEIIKGKLFDHFPLYVWQSGSGTQTNMNMNEVISNYSCRLARKPIASKEFMHPNSDVNMHQSTNDVIPTAMHLSALMVLRDKLIPNIETLSKALKEKQKEFKSQKKKRCGSFSYSEMFESYVYQLKKDAQRCKEVMKSLLDVVLGGTAIGTGLNSPKGFDVLAVKELSKLTNFSLRVHPNKFSAISTHSEICHLSKTLRGFATTLFKIANDIRYLSSGPRCGLNKMQIPENEPGSTIMPGKINPTQCEALTMIAIQVISNDEATTMATSQGYFEASSYRTVMIHNILQSAKILGDGILSFTKYCILGLKLK